MNIHKFDNVLTRRNQNWLHDRWISLVACSRESRCFLSTINIRYSRTENFVPRSGVDSGTTTTPTTASKLTYVAACVKIAEVGREIHFSTDESSTLDKKYMWQRGREHRTMFYVAVALLLSHGIIQQTSNFIFPFAACCDARGWLEIHAGDVVRVFEAQLPPEPADKLNLPSAWKGADSSVESRTTHPPATSLTNYWSTSMKTPPIDK